MATMSRPLAIVTGASSGIGFELAKCCTANGFDILIAADEPEIETAAQALAIFKASEWADAIGPSTELTVAVKNPETTHTVTPNQIRRWCDGVALSPDELLKRIA